MGNGKGIGMVKMNASPGMGGKIAPKKTMAYSDGISFVSHKGPAGPGRTPVLA
jgi:hypothetical protein